MTFDVPTKPCSELRCKKCDKLLIKRKQSGYEIKCTRCGDIVELLKEFDDLFIITDLNRIILYINHAILTFSGFNIEECLGKTPHLWEQMEKSFYKNMWHILLVKKTSFSALVKNQHKNGLIYFCQLTISPILNSNNEVQFLVSTERLSPDKIS